MIALGLILLWLILLTAELEVHGPAHWPLLVALWVVAGFAGWEFGAWLRRRL